MEYGQLTHHLQSDQNYKKNFQENINKSLNQTSASTQESQKSSQPNGQSKVKAGEYKMRIRPDIILGKLIEGSELQNYE